MPNRNQNPTCASKMTSLSYFCSSAIFVTSIIRILDDFFTIFNIINNNIYASIYKNYALFKAQVYLDSCLAVVLFFIRRIFRTDQQPNKIFKGKIALFFILIASVIDFVLYIFGHEGAEYAYTDYFILFIIGLSILIQVPFFFYKNSNDTTTNDTENPRQNQVHLTPQINQQETYSDDQVTNDYAPEYPRFSPENEQQPVSNETHENEGLELEDIPYSPYANDSMESETKLDKDHNSSSSDNPYDPNNTNPYL